MFNRNSACDAEQMMTGMSAAIRHRGPDDSQYLRRDGFHIAFPYGSGLREGAPTEEAQVSELYETM